MVSYKGELSRRVKKISEGMLSKFVDLTLVSVYFGLEASLGGYTKVGLAGEKAVNDLSNTDYNSIKNSFRYLRRKGLIESVKENIILPDITRDGRKRLKSILPFYDEKRVWDKHIYLVTYDFPRQRNIQRDSFRSYLRKIGCGSLQYSVWLTPYNPKRLIEEFVQKYDLDNDLIIISSLGKDGTIGDADLNGLMEKTYELTNLNSRYMEFIRFIRNKIILTKDQVVYSFLTILRDDPQIPFELLPDDWVGDEAYALFKKLTGV